MAGAACDAEARRLPRGAWRPREPFRHAAFDFSDQRIRGGLGRRSHPAYISRPLRRWLLARADSVIRGRYDLLGYRGVQAGTVAGLAYGRRPSTPLAADLLGIGALPRSGRGRPQSDLGAQPASALAVLRAGSRAHRRVALLRRVPAAVERLARGQPSARWHELGEHARARLPVSDVALDPGTVRELCIASGSRAVDRGLCSSRWTAS